MSPEPAAFPSAAHLLSAIVDSSDDAIVSKNLDGIVTSWNRGAERIFGYTESEMIGQPILKVIPEDRRDEEKMILQRIREGGRVDHFDTKRRRKDGTLIDISLTISPVRNDAGVIVGASKIARDITAQKKAVMTLAEANAETLRQNRMKDEFLSTLSHELRTPLQSIMGWLQLLQEGADGEELAQGLEVISRSATALQQIIEDLLDMNRILSGKVRLEVQPLRLGEILQAAVETVCPAAQAKGITLRAVLDPLSSTVAGDAQRLQQVFWNLLTNAIKFTSRGGNVEVLLRRVHSHCEVSITDTGIGISAEFLPYVFDRFQQADASTTRTHAGLGLGLAIVKHLVELHGGTVEAVSPGVGRGTSMMVKIPLAGVGAPAAVIADSGGRSVGKGDLHEVSVLVVDDDADSREMVCRTLRRAGASVEMASGADEALQRIATAAPDVIVSDIGMPGKNGYMFMEELRSRSEKGGGKIPAAALTAYARVEDRVRALRAGFQILLPKPVDTKELLATVSSLARQTA